MLDVALVAVDLCKIQRDPKSQEERESKYCAVRADRERADPKPIRMNCGSLLEVAIVFVASDGFNRTSRRSAEGRMSYLYTDSNYSCLVHVTLNQGLVAIMKCEV